MEDLIPILIFVAISVIGAINNSKKKKNLQRKQAESFQQHEEFEEMPVDSFEEPKQEVSWFEKQLLGLEDEPERIYQPSPQIAEEVKEPVAKTFQEEAQEVLARNQNIIEKEGASDIENKPSYDYDDFGESIADGQIGDAVDEDDGSPISEIMEDFDIKKAVVYSEILGRKYV